MNQAVKGLVRNVLKRFDIGVTSYQNLQRLNELSSTRRPGEDDIRFLLKLPDRQIAPAMRCLRRSRAQLRQDLFVLAELGFKTGGFFVEFGATNGKDLSNTYLLEKDFRWQGIVAEPATCWHRMLRQNRNCRIDTRCVWSSSDATLTFNEVTSPELSTIDTFSDADFHTEARKSGTKYAVKTVTLSDLLDCHDAPREIDYLSIDTEGSELEILEMLDFDRYGFRVITCEHNFTPARDDLHKLLASKGYRRKFEDVSLWDDWYVRL